jgi:hypothetical protein
MRTLQISLSGQLPSSVVKDRLVATCVENIPTFTDGETFQTSRLRGLSL